MLTNYNRLCTLAIELNKRHISVSPIYKGKSPTGNSFDYKNMNEIILARLFHGAIGMYILGGRISNNLEWIKVTLKHQPSKLFLDKFLNKLQIGLGNSFYDLTIITNEINKEKVCYLFYHCESIKPKMVAKREMYEIEKQQLFEQKIKEFGSRNAANEFVNKNDILIFIESFSDGNKISISNGLLLDLKKISDSDRDKIQNIILSFS